MSNSLNSLRRSIAIAIAIVTTLVLPAGSASAQSLDDLPTPPPGAVGPILDPVEELVEGISGPLGDALGDIPLDNAVRLLGDDAVAASVALSQITFTEGSRVALIGRDDVFADTLSSIAAQGLVGAPLLLTQTDAIDDRTAEELQRLGVEEIIILGSTQAVSELVEMRLEMAYGEDNVTRYGGPSRIETAALLAEGLAPQADHVVLFRGYPSEGANQAQAYADALSAGPYASSQGIPSLVTLTSRLHPATEDYIDSAGVQEVTIVGGTEAVSQDVEDTLGAKGLTVNRIAGENRWDTSVLVANAMGMMDVADANRVIVTEGGDVEQPLWAAGFAAAAHGAVFQSPVLLVDGALLPPETIAFIGDGLIRNALRVNNEPVICNSFVDFVACETVALMMAGTLDEANALSGGAIEAVLGPVFDPVAEALDETIPGSGEGSSGLLGDVLGTVGLEGEENEEPAGMCADGIDNDEDGTIDEDDECADDGSVLPTELAFQSAMEDQPLAVQRAVVTLIGQPGDRVSTSRQALLIQILSGVNGVIQMSADTTDPSDAAAVVQILNGISATMSAGNADAALADLAALLEGIDLLDEDGARFSRAGANPLAGAVDTMGVDASAGVNSLTGDVAAALDGADVDLVGAYGAEAERLAAAVDRLT